VIRTALSRITQAVPPANGLGSRPHGLVEDVLEGGCARIVAEKSPVLVRGEADERLEDHRERRRLPIVPD
jgi:hypothetical protein